jgi:hypothetical protein
MRELAALPILLLLSGCGSPPAPPAREPSARKAEAAPVRILQFYAAPSIVAPGQAASVCYGVENADAVRLEPEVEPIKPAFSRCVPVTPRRDTEYTLIATGGGSEVRRSVRVQVRAGAAAPRSGSEAIPTEPAPAGPRIHSFTANPAEIEAGQSVMLCFQVDGERVELQPGNINLGGARVGCYNVSPRQTTEYVLIAREGERAARQPLTVRVK